MVDDDEDREWKGKGEGNGGGGGKTTVFAGLGCTAVGGTMTERGGTARQGRHDGGMVGR
jgi:hypothetical protein